MQWPAGYAHCAGSQRRNTHTEDTEPGQCIHLLSARMQGTIWERHCVLGKEGGRGREGGWRALLKMILSILLYFYIVLPLADPKRARETRSPNFSLISENSSNFASLCSEKGWITLPLHKVFSFSVYLHHKLCKFPNAAGRTFAHM